MSNFPCHILVYEDASQELSEENLRRCNCSSPLSLEYIPEVYMHKLLKQQCYGFFVSEKAKKRFLTSDIVLTPVKDQIAFEVSYIAINTERSPIAKALIDTL